MRIYAWVPGIISEKVSKISCGPVYVYHFSGSTDRDSVRISGSTINAICSQYPIETFRVPVRYSAAPFQHKGISALFNRHYYTSKECNCAFREHGRAPDCILPRRPLLGWQFRETYPQKRSRDLWLLFSYCVHLRWLDLSLFSSDPHVSFWFLTMISVRKDWEWASVLVAGTSFHGRIRQLKKSHMPNYNMWPHCFGCLETAV